MTILTLPRVDSAMGGYKGRLPVSGAGAGASTPSTPPFRRNGPLPFLSAGPPPALAPIASTS